MIEKLQKIFHTDKWWGKSIFIIVFYFVFWCIFYGSLVLINNSWQQADFDIYGDFMSISLFFLFILVPISTLFIFPKIFKKINIKQGY